uniref:Uncharacterized protein n=1 Tax=Steinernema glaseri TaxID=37863 RepID=A0A1I7Y2Q5_9BILA
MEERIRQLDQLTVPTALPCTFLMKGDRNKRAPAKPNHTNKVDEHSILHKSAPRGGHTWPEEAVIVNLRYRTA